MVVFRLILCDSLIPGVMQFVCVKDAKNKDITSKSLELAAGVGHLPFQRLLCCKGRRYLSKCPAGSVSVLYNQSPAPRNETDDSKSLGGGTGRTWSGLSLHAKHPPLPPPSVSYLSGEAGIQEVRLAPAGLAW